MPNVTEDQAKTKWCPRAHNGSSQKCVASACMAWRWAFDPRPGFSPARTAEEYLARDPQENVPVVVSQTNGFCGLAGKP